MNNDKGRITITKTILPNHFVEYGFEWEGPSVVRISREFLLQADGDTIKLFPDGKTIKIGPFLLEVLPDMYPSESVLAVRIYNREGALSHGAEN